MGWQQWIRRVEIVPSLTGAKPDAIAGQVEALLRAGCRIFHLDDDLDLLERLGPLIHRYDGIVDLRLSNPADLPAAIALGADSVTMAAVTPSVSQEIRAAARQLGVIFAGGPVLDVDLVSVAVDGSAASVERVREVANELMPGVWIQVVGDLGQDSVRAFSDAGATVIVVGRSIFDREDLPRAYRRLVQALA